MDGRQIVTSDEEGHREALGICVNRGIPGIARYTNKLFWVPAWNGIHVQEIRDVEYAWNLTDRPGPKPEKKIFTIKVGSTTRETELEDGEPDEIGEWLPRRIGQIISPFPQCQIVGPALTNSAEAVSLWQGEPAGPTIREKEHTFVFHGAEKKFTSRPAKCGFPYDLEEIVPPDPPSPKGRKSASKASASQKAPAGKKQTFTREGPAGFHLQENQLQRHRPHTQ
jgi:hypothetical protein